MKPSTLPALLLIVFTISLSGCGPSQSLKDEAYQAGWNAVYQQKCQGKTIPMKIPSKYDDSMGSGKVLEYYRAGFYDAQNNPNLCK